jgi:hypothetical protein
VGKTSTRIGSASGAARQSTYKTSAAIIKDFVGRERIDGVAAHAERQHRIGHVLPLEHHSFEYAVGNVGNILRMARLDNLFLLTKGVRHSARIAFRALPINHLLRASLDPGQFINRVRSRDFDMIYTGWGQSLSPGNEQLEFWGSRAADRPGSRNTVGIKNPAVDALIDRVIFAKSREELVAATKALDRVLLWNHYVVPQWTYGKLQVVKKAMALNESGA